MLLHVINLAACKFQFFVGFCNLILNEGLSRVYASVYIMNIMLQERCVAVDTMSLVARILNRSKAHLQSMLLQSNATVLEDFYLHLVCGIFNIFPY